jgi:putative ABC transport system permease protein
VERRIKVGSEWFLVVGIMQNTSRIAEAAGVLATRDLNRDIYIPLDTALSRRAIEPPVSELTQLTLRVHSGASVEATAMAAKRIIERRHFGAADVGFVVPEQLIREKQKEQRMFNVVLGSIAAISLLVGGIGIMNIMLASVLERRKEIGVRRALGARRADILSQFLAEAATISLTGGVIGIGLGILLARSIRLVAQFEAVPTALAIFVAFGVSVTTGLLFGYYPARQAAGTHPIEALRYE